MKPPLMWVFVSLSLLQLTCGLTRENVLDQYRPRFSEKRAQFLRLLDALPPPGSVKENRCQSGLDPSPLYDAPNRRFNTEIVMADQLADPDQDLRSQGKLDLLLSGDLMRAIQWTGPENPMAETALEERTTSFAAELEKALGYPYLVVLRPLEFKRPVAIDRDTVESASALVEGFLVDLRSEDIVGAWRFDAISNEQGTYTYKANTEDPLVRLEEADYSSLFSNLRLELQEILHDLTGGTFVLDRL